MYMEFKPGKKHASKDAEISDSLGSFTDAGYVLTDNDLVVDIDSMSHFQIEKMLEVFNINTEVVWTGRGAHLYFKKPDGFRGAKGVCALGVEVEYKHKKNANAVTVKLDGIARKVERKGIREQLPDFLKKGNYEVLTGLSEGDGRNNKMFAHRRKMGNMSDWKLCIQYINDYLFDTPLPQTELQTLLRDMSVEAVKDGESAIADEIMREKRVVMYSGRLYYYDGRQYISDDALLNRLVYQYCPGQKSVYVKEVIEQMNRRAKLIDPGATFHIKFRNGVLKDGRFIEVDYKDFTPYTIDIDYKPDAVPVKEVDNYLKQLTENDPDYQQLLLEILAHPLITNKEFKRMMGKFFIFVGDGGNGKGTMLTIIRKILTDANCSGLSIKNMTDERYLNVLAGKLVNLGDDIQDEPINNEQMKMLKNISTCDYVEIRKLFENSKSAELTTTLIFTSNHVLKSFEKGESYKRRVVWLPMYTKPAKKDPKFITKLTTQEAREYWVKLIVEGYMRLYTNQTFTESQKVTEYNTEYHKENNTALQFVLDLDPETEILTRRPPEVYAEYETWCTENGYHPQSTKAVGTAVREVWKIESKQRKINGKNYRVYQRL